MRFKWIRPERERERDLDDEIEAAVLRSYSDALARGDDEDALRWRTFGEPDGMKFN